ncbi:hypothetical protein GPALN_004476 [Globodera pallida]|nr:hypothetical protein GPALN_004476 [Globodera pallida]
MLLLLANLVAVVVEFRSVEMKLGVYEGNLTSFSSLFQLLSFAASSTHYSCFRHLFLCYYAFFRLLFYSMISLFLCIRFPSSLSSGTSFSVLSFLRFFFRASAVTSLRSDILLELLL